MFMSAKSEEAMVSCWADGVHTVYTVLDGLTRERRVDGVCGQHGLSKEWEFKYKCYITERMDSWSWLMQPPAPS